MVVQGGRSTLSLFFLGPSCTSFQSPNPAEQQMNSMKVLRSDSVESLRDSSFSAGTEQSLLQAILGPRAEPARVLSPPAPKEKKSRRTSYNSLFQHHPCYRAGLPLRGAQQRQSRGCPAWCQCWGRQGHRGKQHHSTSQQQGEKVGFGASRVQGIPKPPVGPHGCSQGRFVQGTAPSAQPGKEQPPPHSAPTRTMLSPSCWDRGHPLCQGSTTHTGDIS